MFEGKKKTTFNVEIRLLLPVVRDRNRTNFLLVQELTLDEQPAMVCGLQLNSCKSQSGVEKNAFRAVLCSAKTLVSFDQIVTTATSMLICLADTFFFSFFFFSFLPLCFFLCGHFLLL